MSVRRRKAKELHYFSTITMENKRNSAWIYKIQTNVDIYFLEMHNTSKLFEQYDLERAVLMLYAIVKYHSATTSLLI